MTITLTPKELLDHESDVNTWMRKRLEAFLENIEWFPRGGMSGSQKELIDKMTANIQEHPFPRLLPEV